MAGCQVKLSPLLDTRHRCLLKMDCHYGRNYARGRAIFPAIFCPAFAWLARAFQHPLCTGAGVEGHHALFRRGSIRQRCGRGFGCHRRSHLAGAGCGRHAEAAALPARYFRLLFRRLLRQGGPRIIWGRLLRRRITHLDDTRRRRATGFSNFDGYLGHVDRRGRASAQGVLRRREYLLIGVAPAGGRLV